MKYTKDYLPGKYEIGEFSYGTPNVRDVKGNGKLTIGRFCSIADNVEIFLGMDHKTSWFTTYPFGADNKKWPKKIQEIYKKGGVATKGDIVIGNDVWIGSKALILSGVTIGDGAVIAARSVVTKDVAPYTIVAGNPARSRKKRFNDETINLLQKLKWWDWPIEKLNHNIHILCSKNIIELNGLL